MDKTNRMNGRFILYSEFSTQINSLIYCNPWRTVASMIFTEMITVMHGLTVSLESRRTKPEIPGMNT